MTDTQQKPLQTGFGRASEPDDVLQGVDLAGRSAIVTGGYSGIGLETTRALADRGARVIVPVRTPEKADQTLADVQGDVTTVEMDLADLATVRRAAKDLVDGLEQLDLLILNAGIMATPEGRVGPGWERQLGVNHMGHFALTSALMPLLRQTEQPRVVALSSVAHKRNGIRWDDLHFRNQPYDKWVAYAQAKTANALFARALSPRLHDLGGRAFSVHPGGIFTPLQRDLPLEEQVQLGWRTPDGEPSEMARQGFKSPTQGASTTLWAATSPDLDARSGVYCEDGDVALPVDQAATPWGGVAAHATDEEAAERLWAISERMLAEA